MSEQLTEKTVQLDTPIKRGKTEIAEIVLRKPQSGALRGTRLQAIMDMDVGAMMTIIPRISTPALTAQEMAEMDPADLTALSVEVVTFLLKKSVLADLVADIATIFHWPPSVTDVMPLTEVLEWRHKAIQRSGASDE